MDGQVLLVKDDLVIRKTMDRMLSNMNCELIVTSNGKEALDILQRTLIVKYDIDEKHEFPTKFDLVLMDGNDTAIW